ncbi:MULTISPECIES: hypothetical protein [Bacteroidales]|uniref:hypothetical protein n=1 Tax=Bacteroidales TaxID=171549 RepID=UPI000FFE34F2|nr:MULTISPECIES: hypothetical protein [Bacteroidales]RXE70693.1 hypothetical protein ED352_08830 [Muribaculaceae bacterium Isolate-002 (NCI)]
MIKINYKSDFEFLLRLRCANSEMGFPDFDWVARIWTANKIPAYTVSCIGGKCTNCYNDNGTIHVVMNNHRLGPGVLNIEFICNLPDSVYPDGGQRIVVPCLDERIELIREATPVPESFEIEAVLPVIKGEPGVGAYPAAYITLVTDGGSYRIPVLAPGIEYTPAATGYGYYYNGSDNFYTIGDWDI